MSLLRLTSTRVGIPAPSRYRWSSEKPAPASSSSLTPASRRTSPRWSWADLDAELDALFNEQNTPGEDASSIPATFLRVSVSR